MSFPKIGNFYLDTCNIFDKFGNIYPGDIILKIDGKKMNTLIDIVEILDNKKIGDEIEITYLRKSKKKTVKAILQKL